MFRQAAGAACAALLLAAAAAGQPGPTENENLHARAWDALRSRLLDEKYLDHSLAVEAILRELAGAAGGDREEWGLAGLLHDIDIGTTANDLTRHGVAGAQILRDLGFSPVVIHAVLAHDDRPGVPRTSRLDHSLYAGDQIYWLILSTGLKFHSEELNSSQPEAVWEEIQRLTAKRAILAEVTEECSAAGIEASWTVKTAHAALRKLSQSMTGQRKAAPGER